jgi:hypothetical protein
MIRSSKGRWRRNVSPPGDNLGRCRNKITSNIVPRMNKILDPLDELWEIVAMEVFKSLYPGGSDGFDLRESGVPIGG